MKTISMAMQVLACGVLSATLAPSALAQAQRGFYVGVGAGTSRFDLDKDEVDDFVIDSFRFEGAPVLFSSSTLDDGDTAMTLFFGYRFLPYVAVEASYLDLGTAQYRFTGAVNPPGPVASAPATFNMNVETHGLTLAGIGSLPLGNVADLHGRLGFLVAKTDISATAIIGSSRGYESDSLSATSAFLGIGVGFHLGTHVSLSLDGSRYFNVGDENDDDDYETAEGIDIDALTFSVAYRF